MRKFNVNVNGNSYVVEVEELGVTETAPVSTKVQPVSTPVAAAKPANVSGGVSVESPMPGKVLKVCFKDGDAVKKNQPVIVLEAMKMENEVVATADGIITYAVKAGEDVNSKQLIASIK